MEAKHPTYMLEKMFDPMYTTHSFTKPKFNEMHGIEIKVKYYTGTGCPPGYFDINDFNDAFKGMLNSEQLMQVATMKPGETYYRTPPRFKPAK